MPPVLVWGLFSLSGLHRRNSSASCVLATVTWGVESLIQKAQHSHPDPGGGRPNRFFVPDTVRSQVLLAFVHQRFWWPSMSRDTHAFVSACSVCARSQVSHQTPAGQLQQLLIPHRPRSHIAVDFVTGLPASVGNTTILSVVDRYSKAVHFIPLTKLPSALKTADLLVLHVFRLHGIPLDVVSDRGLQFSSQVWKTLCRALGATASLSSGYHPQMNGQTERANQDPESALRCVTAHNPSFWSMHLPWVEYAHNALTSTAIGMSPFMASLVSAPCFRPRRAQTNRFKIHDLRHCITFSPSRL